MRLMKCPRCELNYIKSTEKLCQVCRREMKGGASEDEVEMCSICNEYPAIPGKDVCGMCLKEMEGERSNGRHQAEDEEDQLSSTAGIAGVDSVSEMEEMMPEIADDIPAESLEEIRESEEEDGDEDEGGEDYDE